MKKVRKIEVPQKNNLRRLRVVAYCRVSTKYESQRSSIELENESSIYEQLLEEAKIEKLYCAEEYEKAAIEMQSFMDEYVKDV